MNEHEIRQGRRTAAVLVLAVAAGTLLLTVAKAEAGPAERVAPVRHAAMAKGCGECHMAFQPGLLPAEGWRRIMGVSQPTSARMPACPRTSPQASPSTLSAMPASGDGRLSRVTEQAWWIREHRFSSTTWQKVGGAKANCAACHPNAAMGQYED